jgi:voltage-gated potassium channel Kch
MTASNAKSTVISSKLLLVLLATTIFIAPVAPVEIHEVLFSLLYSAVFIVAALSMEKHRGLMLWLAVGVTALEWIAGSLDLKVVSSISQVLNTAFFGIVALSLIVQIARTKRVTLQVIVAAVNGYLLLGMIASMAVSLIVLHAPAAFNFPPLPAGVPADVSRFAEYLYYGFVTFTTVGYGDVVPQLPYTRSLATLIGVVGQMYVAIIIAMLVGKYAASGSGDGP